MIELGRFNEMKVARFVSFGAYLELGEQEILMPTKYLPENVQVGDDIEVFVYKDSEDRLIATNITPLAQRDEFACLEVKAVSSIGAFLEWGLEKDLLVPHKEQADRMDIGRKYMVRVALDHRTDRLIGTSRLGTFLRGDISDLKYGEEVSVTVYSKTDLGYKVIVNGNMNGLIYKNEVFEDLHIGDERKAFVKKIREDDKLDISLTKQGYGQISDIQVKIMEMMESEGGFLPLHDKSDPNDIKLILGMSKKNFKKAIGGLYKEGKIKLTDEGIELVE